MITRYIASQQFIKVECNTWTKPNFTFSLIIMNFEKSLMLYLNLTMASDCKLISHEHVHHLSMNWRDLKVFKLVQLILIIIYSLSSVISIICCLKFLSFIFTFVLQFAYPKSLYQVVWLSWLLELMLLFKCSLDWFFSFTLHLLIIYLSFNLLIFGINEVIIQIFHFLINIINPKWLSV